MHGNYGDKMAEWTEIDGNVRIVIQQVRLVFDNTRCRTAYTYIWDSVQLNHPYGTFSKTSKRKIALALKCMANYKFSA